MLNISLKLSASACVLTALCSAPAGALVVVPDSSVASQPSDTVLARWGGNASGVVITSEHVLTTRHQSGGVGTTVKVDGVNYEVVEVTNIQDPDTPTNTLDLRVVRLVNQDTNAAANFTDFVGIYEGTDEVGQTMVIGGYGEGRGAEIRQGNNLLGYEWDGSEGTLRWGANSVTGTQADASFSNDQFQNDILKAVFDSSGVDGEATVAKGDSGGGWFINDGGQWKVAALSQGVQFTDEARFGEDLSAVRLSSYANQINNAVPEPGSALLLAGAIAGLAVRRRR